MNTQLTFFDSDGARGGGISPFKLFWTQSLDWYQEKKKSILLYKVVKIDDFLRILPLPEMSCPVFFLKFDTSTSTIFVHITVHFDINPVRRFFWIGVLYKMNIFKKILHPLNLNASHLHDKNSSQHQYDINIISWMFISDGIYLCTDSRHPSLSPSHIPHPLKYAYCQVCPTK